MRLSNRKLRGQRRLFRRLHAWSKNFLSNFPARDILEHSYWSWKIPVPYSLVQGRRARMKAVVHCAQLLLDATARMRDNRPNWANDLRITCCISTQDVFASEICLYIDEEYYQRMISPVNGEYEVKERILGGSLAKRWNLVLPDGFDEIGVRVFWSNDEDDDYQTDWWFFGDVKDKASP